MTPPVDIAGLRGLVERATPGPWEVETYVDGDEDDLDARRFHSLSAAGDDFDLLVTSEPCHAGLSRADAELVVAAVNALPALCDRVEELERENAYLAEVRDQAVGYSYEWFDWWLKAHAATGLDHMATMAQVVDRIGSLAEENARLRAEVANLRRRGTRGPVFR